MAIALVKLTKNRNGKTTYFLDYISFEAAKLGVAVQGKEHNEIEYSTAEILRVWPEQKSKKDIQ